MSNTINKKLLAACMAVIIAAAFMPVFAHEAYADDGTRLSANSKTASRTQATVLNLYNNSVKSYSTSAMFATAPVLIRDSYNKGTLSADAIAKTIQQINYFRAMAGLNNDVVAYTAKMDYGQYGATGMEIVNALTHSFTTAQQNILVTGYMTSAEFDKAKAGIGAGNSDLTYTLWNANCSSTNNVVQSIQGYIDDTNNVSAGVGHRLNFLSTFGRAAVFGAGKNSYSCVSIYGYDDSGNSQDYYAWPTEGYFPEQAIADSASWSVQFSKEYVNTTLSNLAISVEYGGTTYSIPSSNIDTDTIDNGQCHTIAFKLPASVQSALSASSSVYNNAGIANVKVKVTGIKDSSNNSRYAEYTVKMFKQLPVPLQSISLNSTSGTIAIGEKKQLSVTYSPNNTTASKTVSWSSSNSSVASVTPTGGLVTGVGAGSATITAQCGTAKASATITVSSKGIVSPAKVKITALKSTKSKTITLSWKSVSSNTGYQILIATDKKFKKGKKSVDVKSGKTSKKLIKSLKKKKLYYVKIRAYKTVDGKKYYGAYSAVKSIRTK